MTSRNGVSRTILIYKPENFDAAVEEFSRTLGIKDLDPITPDGFGLRVAVSWDTGLEIIAPHGDDGFSAGAWQFIKDRGEGLFGIVWQVADLAAGEKRAASAGYPRRGERLNCFLANPDWKARFSLAMEAPLPPIAGVEMTLIQLEPAK